MTLAAAVATGTRAVTSTATTSAAAAAGCVATFSIYAAAINLLGAGMCMLMRLYMDACNVARNVSVSPVRLAIERSDAAVF